MCASKLYTQNFVVNGYHWVVWTCKDFPLTAVAEQELIRCLPPLPQPPPAAAAEFEKAVTSQQQNEAGREPGCYHGNTVSTAAAAAAAAAATRLLAEQ